MLSQIPCPALTCPDSFSDISLFWWKVLTGERTGDIHSQASLSGPADCGASLGFASSSTWEPVWLWARRDEQGEGNLVLPWHQGGDELFGTH